MKTTHLVIARGFAKHADDKLTKTASHEKIARRRRWLEDSDLVKLCKLFKNKQRH